MPDRNDWERERMRDRGTEMDRDARGPEEWRESDRDRESQYRGEERHGNWGDRDRAWEEARNARDRRYQGSRGHDYGPGAFTQQFRNEGPQYFGAGQRGYGTTWGGLDSGSAGPGGYSGGPGGISGGMGTYAGQGRFVGRGPKGYQRSDERIREDVCERLTQHPEIDAVDIDIQVKGGEVTLAGTVTRREEKRMAEDVADSVSGVKDVHNQLRTQQGTQSLESQSQTDRETIYRSK
jgi:hypothetical protein